MWTVLALALMQAASGTLPLTDIAQGPDSAIAEPREAIARTAAEWQALWAAHDPSPPPAVDLSRSMVVGVFLGLRPTAGFRVEITAVATEGARIIVRYVEHQPDPGDLVAAVLTAPFHLVAAPRSDGEVVFRQEPPAP